MASSAIRTSLGILHGFVSHDRSTKHLTLTLTESGRSDLTSNVDTRYIPTFLILLSLLFSGNDNVINEDEKIWSLGFGAVSEGAIFNHSYEENSHHILTSSLLANTPQLVLSVLYLIYNSLFTSMLTAQEWNRYTRHRKALRVTSPVGEQRTTYWLQLPWTYSIPLGIASCVLHWLVSQSIFLVYIKKYDPNHNLVEGSTTIANGYSAYAMVIVIIVGFALVLGLIVNGLRRLEPGVPLVGSCSLAISAACHRPQDDHGASLLPLKWGCVSHETTDGLGHCCFTSFEVEEPIVGQRYV